MVNRWTQSETSVKCIHIFNKRLHLFFLNREKCFCTSAFQLTHSFSTQLKNTHVQKMDSDSVCSASERKGERKIYSNKSNMMKKTNTRSLTHRLWYEAFENGFVFFFSIQCAFCIQVEWLGLFCSGNSANKCTKIADDLFNFFCFAFAFSFYSLIRSFNYELIFHAIPSRLAV